MPIEETWDKDTADIDENGRLIIKDSNLVKKIQETADLQNDEGEIYVVDTEQTEPIQTVPVGNCEGIVVFGCQKRPNINPSCTQVISAESAGSGGSVEPEASADWIQMYVREKPEEDEAGPNRPRGPLMK